MGEWTPVLAAIVSGVLLIVGGSLASGRLRKVGLSDEQLRVNTALRELADVETRKREIVEEQLSEERQAISLTMATMKAEHEAALAVEVAAHTVTRRLLDDRTREFDDCERQLDDTRHDLRVATERAAPRRRGGTTP